jgi:hypothetical protein
VRYVNVTQWHNNAMAQVNTIDSHVENSDGDTWKVVTADAIPDRANATQFLQECPAWLATAATVAAAVSAQSGLPGRYHDPTEAMVGELSMTPIFRQLLLGVAIRNSCNRLPSSGLVVSFDVSRLMGCCLL